MKYRKFGLLDWKISALGFGVNSLPVIGSIIDGEKSTEMIRTAIDEGVNYIDAGDRRYELRYNQTAQVLKNALYGGYRSKVRIFSGMPVKSIFSRDDFYKYLDEDLQRLNTEKIDFCFLAGLDRTAWKWIQEINLLKCFDTVLSDGRIGGAGFSFNDHFRYLHNITEGYDKWTFCRFRYSYMDADRHPGTAGVKYAAAKGLAVIIDEPLLSGRLVREVPESVLKVWQEAKGPRSTAEWALLWILNHPEVSSVLCSMSSPEEIKENTSLTDRYSPDCFTVQELLLINRIRDSYHKRKVVQCTTCRACMPCHAGIDIPRILELYNEAAMFGNKDIPSAAYKMEGHSIDTCNFCGKCARICGRKIPIPEQLKEADRLLSVRF